MNYYLRRSSRGWLLYLLQGKCSVDLCKAIGHQLALLFDNPDLLFNLRVHNLSSNLHKRSLFSVHLMIYAL